MYGKQVQRQPQKTIISKVKSQWIHVQEKWLKLKPLFLALQYRLSHHGIPTVEATSRASRTSKKICGSPNTVGQYSITMGSIGYIVVYVNKYLTIHYIIIYKLFFCQFAGLHDT